MTHEHCAHVDSTRPVRVLIERMDNKKRILSRATNLRAVPEESDYARVYIRPDLTIDQLEASNNLYAKLRQKRLDYPDSTWKITKGVIVETNLPRREDPPIGDEAGAPPRREEPHTADGGGQD